MCRGAKALATTKNAIITGPAISPPTSCGQGTTMPGYERRLQANTSGSSRTTTAIARAQGAGRHMPVSRSSASDAVTVAGYGSHHLILSMLATPKGISDEAERLLEPGHGERRGTHTLGAWMPT